MGYDYQFVDAISSTPTVRLNLARPVWNVRDTTTFGTPELRRSTVGTLLVDGEQYPAAAYGNRVINLAMRLEAATDDAVATALQSLYRELNRPSNILRYRPGTTEAVFFRTFRTAPDNVIWNPVTKEVRASIPAEPFAYGTKQTLTAVTVYNDPAEGVTLNANPNFETDAANWTATGGAAVRSTAQAHEGTASLLFTPGGVAVQGYVESEQVPVTAGTSYRASAWVRCNVTRTAGMGINWYDSGGVYLSTSSMTATSVTAVTWALLDYTATAPVSAAYATVNVVMGSTPSITHLLYVDEARIRQVGGSGGVYFDVTSVRGDVETPLFLSIEQGDITDSRQSVIGVRRRGTPASMPMVLQAESMTAGTDTALGASNDTTFSGSGQNYMRTTFVTTTLTLRASLTAWPPAGVDARGIYRVFVRVRKTVPGDVMWVRVTAGGINSEVAVSDASSFANAHYVDVGLLQLPPGMDPVTDGFSGSELSVQSTGFSVAAARASGSGNLDIDHVLLVPADDRLAVVDWPVDSTLTSLVFDSARTMVYALGSGGEVRATVQAKIAGLPPMVSPGVTNRVVFVQDTGALQVGLSNRLTSTTEVTPYYWPRYLTVAAVGS